MVDRKFAERGGILKYGGRVEKCMDQKLAEGAANWGEGDPGSEERLQATWLRGGPQPHPAATEMEKGGQWRGETVMGQLMLPIARVAEAGVTGVRCADPGGPHPECPPPPLSLPVCPE